jgi:hypothetical protein
MQSRQWASKAVFQAEIYVLAVLVPGPLCGNELHVGARGLRRMAQFRATAP